MVSSKAKRSPGRRKGLLAQLASLRKQLGALRTERLKHLHTERSLQKKMRRQAGHLAEQERKIREFLDSTLQSLYAVGLGLEASKSLVETNPRRAADDLARSIDQLNSLSERSRAALTSL